MNKNITNYLTRLQEDIEKKKEELDRVEKDPLVFLTHLVWERSGVIPMVIEERDQSELIHYQDWLYPKVLDSLEMKFNTSKFQLTYNETIFPSPISFLYEGNVLAEIRPYDHQIVLFMPDEPVRLMEQMLDVQVVIAMLEDEIKIREREEANPLLLGGSNPLSLIKISATKKKTLSSIKEKAINQLEELTKSRLDFQKLQYELNKCEGEFLLAYEVLERILKRIADVYNFELMDERTILRDQFNEKLFAIKEPSIDITVEKGNKDE